MWTGTPMFVPQRNSLILHTLSQCLAREHFACTELVTDDRGMFISEVLGWEYSAIVNSLNQDTSPLVNYMWARGKIRAILNQDSDFAHIDNDVLIFGPLPRRVREARLCAERIDNPWYYRSEEGIACRDHAGLPEGHLAYNCGLIGGTDIHLLHKYAFKALELSDKFQGMTNNGTIVSMIFEQYWFGCFARAHRVRVETILPAWTTKGEVRAAKWFHMTGDIKRSPEMIEKVERRLQNQFPKAYKRFTRGWRSLQQDISTLFPATSS